MKETQQIGEQAEGSLGENLRKAWRYSTIYGFRRTLNKIAGRMRGLRFLRPRYLRNEPAVGLIGCGQFQFSTIAWFLSRQRANPFLCCYDPDRERAESLAGYYGVPQVLDSPEKIYEIGGLSLAYVASNHASHTGYAERLLRRGVDVYCEKPLAVNFEQFRRLRSAVESSKARFYAGYNRPYAPAVRDLRDRFHTLEEPGGRFTLNCYISAHDIPEDHWYRDPEEGTRICGNVGHWLDLMVHILGWRGAVPGKYRASIAYSDLDEPDDNISISLTTQRGDLTTIVISSRSEPFEGINETINFQYGSLIAKIDDFRSMQLWEGRKLTRRSWWPKDVGHRRAVLQPMPEHWEDNRDIAEVFASTELMLHLAEMVRRGETEREIELTTAD